jgi:apolipoprotein N-acyltransferase
VLVVGTFAYGRFRFAQDTLYPGPRVMVVQPNHQHARGGAKLVTQEQQIEFHLRVTRDALSKGGRPDVVVWSETVMPPLNAEARDALRRESSGKFLEEIHQTLAQLAREHRTSLVTGAYYVGGWKPVDGKLTATDIRNSAYVYDPTGTQFAGRYDKIHLVPFSEIMPMRQTIPILHRALLRLAAYSAEYPLVPGPADALTVFTLRPFVNDALAGEPSWKFVTPICSEDFDAPLIASMFRPGPDGRKRADFIANLTNDGWFRGNMRDQHLQCAVFRSIENRAPTARADNTGISGFIDPLGRTSNLIGKGEEGTATQQLMLDRRVSFYSRVGDVFGIGCFVLTCAAGLSPVIRRVVMRRGSA